MIAVLAGHDGRIKGACAHLVRKYLPLDVLFVQTGNINEWASDVSRAVRKLPDSLVFALDDYLLAGPLDVPLFERLVSHKAPCARLCDSAFYERKLYIEDGLFLLGSQMYTVTTQYCIWDRSVLLEVLAQVNTPWEFELDGSSYFNARWSTLASDRPALVYPGNSALSARWPGKVKVKDNPVPDVEELIALGLLERSDLIYE